MTSQDPGDLTLDWAGKDFRKLFVTYVSQLFQHGNLDLKCANSYVFPL